MSWEFEGSDQAGAVNPIFEKNPTEDCLPCVNLFDPVFIDGNYLRVGPLDHMKQFIFTANLNSEIRVDVDPFYIDLIPQAGITIIFTQAGTSYPVLYPSPGMEDIKRSTAMPDSKGASIGLISANALTYTVVGETRLEVE